MDPISSLRRLWANTDRATVLLSEIRDINARVAGLLERRSEGFVDLSCVVAADVEILPVTEIGDVHLDLDAPDCIDKLRTDSAFLECARFFAHSPSAKRALVSAETQALLYALIRTLRPGLMIEVGTFQASTTEAMARAAHANRFGMIHTIDPFGAARAPAVFAAWPQALRDHVRFSAVNSMTYFAELALNRSRAGLIFVDGNHDHEFALFDLLSAARFVEPGGVIALDNIAQPGPFLALRDFLAMSPGWAEIGSPVANRPIAGAFDLDRTQIHNTDLALLRAPRGVMLTARPFSEGQAAFRRGSLSGVKLQLAEPATGRLAVQFVFRTFGERPEEKVLEADTTLKDAGHEQRVMLATPFACEEQPGNTLEIWYRWDGAEPLKLAASPVVL